MRYREFLVEYRRDITAQNYGDKILRAFAEMPRQYFTGDVYDTMRVDPSTWSNLRTVAALIKHPESYGDIDTNMRINGKLEDVNIKTAPEILRSNASLIINGILALLESKDPTPNKEYTQWLVRMWCASPLLRFEDINRNDMLGIHYLAKRRRMLLPEHTDINRFSSYADFENTMDHMYDLDEIARGAPTTDKGTSELVYEDSDMRIIVPKDVAAACYYGQGSRWCTAATRGTNYFERYNRSGPLYIILPKKPQYEGEKYQLHFAEEQYMNEGDEPISLQELVKRFPHFKDWLLKTFPDSKNYLDFISDERLANYWNTGLEILDPLIDEVMNEWEMNDDGYRRWQIEKAEKLGYVLPDGDIDWDTVSNDDNLNDYGDYNQEYADTIQRIETLKQQSAASIRAEIDDYLGSKTDYSTDLNLSVSDLDEIYRHVFQGIFGRDSQLSDKIYRDLLIYPTEKFGTNRPIIARKDSDGYVFALAAPTRRR